jgi:hypothetical protein
VVATSKASKRSKTAAEMREEARQCLEAAGKEKDVAVRTVLHDEALRLAMAAEQLDKSGTRKKPAA